MSTAFDQRGMRRTMTKVAKAKTSQLLKLELETQIIHSTTTKNVLGDRIYLLLEVSDYAQKASKKSSHQCLTNLPPSTH